MQLCASSRRIPPNMPEVREALECVVGETYRAGNIIGRIRDQIKKAPPRVESMDLNKAVEEVLALVRGELSKNGVSVHVRTGKDYLLLKEIGFSFSKSCLTSFSIPSKR